MLELDVVAWEPGKPAQPRATDDAIRAVREFCAAPDSWVIEGCYGDLVRDAHLDCVLEWVRAYPTHDNPLSLRAHRALFDGYAGPKQEITQ